MLVEPITLWLVASQHYKKVHQPCQNAGLADLLVAHDDELEQEVAGLSLTHPRFRQQQQEQQQQQQQQSLTPSTKVQNEAAAAVTKSRNRLKYFAFTFKKLVELRRWNERKKESFSGKSIPIEIFGPSVKAALLLRFGRALLLTEKKEMCQSNKRA